MAKELVQSVTIEGTAKHFRGVMQRLNILWDGSWTASNGEILEFEEKRLITRSVNTDSTQFVQYADKTPPNRTSWLVKSSKPVTEEEFQSKIPAIRARFAKGPDDHPEDHTKPWKTAGVEVWELPGNKSQVDFIDTYAPHSPFVAGEALWLPIGPAFLEFSEAILERPEIVIVQEKAAWLTKQASDEIQVRIPEIVQIIESWIPKQLFRSEEAYEAALAEYLEGRGITAPEQQGTSLVDILAANGIGIEAKLNPNRSEYDRLVGQIVRHLENHGNVIVLIVRPDKRDLLEEYKSRFAGDNRVIFVTKP